MFLNTPISKSKFSKKKMSKKTFQIIFIIFFFFLVSSQPKMCFLLLPFFILHDTLLSQNRENYHRIIITHRIQFHLSNFSREFL